MPLIKNPGRYTATVESAELGQSEAKGTPYLSLLCKTTEGEDLTAYLYLSDAAFERTTKTLREVFGFDNNFEKVVEQVTSKECSIVVEAEEFEGKSRMKVKWINTVGGSGKPLENAGSLLAQLSAKAKRIPSAAPSAVRAAARPAPADRPAPAPKPAAVGDGDPF